MSKKTDKKAANRPIVYALDPVAISEAKKTEEESLKNPKEQTFLGSIFKSLQDQEHQRRMAFQVDPANSNSAFGGIYRQKVGLTPNHILRKISGPQGDDLVNQILQARSNLLASLGRPRTSRFSVGFEFQEITKNKLEQLSESKVEEIKKTIDKTKEVLWNCGYKGLDEDWHPNLSQLLKMIVRDALTVGYCAIEFIYTTDDNGNEVCHSFRPVDAATIFKINPAHKKDKSKRREALQVLQQLDNKKFDVEKYDRDVYKWCQVVHGQPVQVFTDKELVVYNIYPTTNIDYNGYPLTPIDQSLNAIATHINIGIHNKLYFENGRAARGMLIFQSDDLDESTIQKIRLQFHQSINSVNNSWRMPVFGVGSEDNVTWQSIDVSGRDKEFQYLSDDNARVILGAFQISPDELPGYAHLSRGTNTQALAESDNEYKLTAARDVGLRPLIYDFQDLFNTHILPKFAPELSKTHQLVFAGLEEDSPEREATRLSQDIALHMTYDEVLNKVEKDPLGKEFGGEFPLSQQWQMSIAPYLTVGYILENFFGIKDASKDPRYNYIRDPFWFQYQQIVMQKAQMAMQQQMMQQQQIQQQQIQQGEAPQESEASQENEAPQEDSGEQMMPPPPQDVEKHEQWMKDNYEFLSKKTKNNHNEITKLILARHKELTDKNMSEWEKNSKKALDEILKTIKDKKKK